MSWFHSHIKGCVKNNWLQDEPSFTQKWDSKYHVRDSNCIKELGLDSQDDLNLSYNCIYCGSIMRCLNKVCTDCGWQPSAYFLNDKKIFKKPKLYTFFDVLVMELEFQSYANYWESAGCILIWSTHAPSHKSFSLDSLFR